MPGFCTHYQFGVNVYKQLNNHDLKRIIRTHRHAYVLGAQGPDLFYYEPITRLGGMQSIPNRMHKRETNLFLQNLMNYTRKELSTEEYETCIAYTCGFLTHYILDSRLHPYVYATVGTKANGRTLGEHNGLETDIDRLVLLHYKGIHLEGFDHRKVAKVSEREIAAIAGLLKESLRKTYRIRILKSTVRGAIRGFKIESFLRIDKKHHKHRLIQFIERYTVGYPFVSALLMNQIRHSADPCNENHRTWINPWDDTKRSNESVFDLLDHSSPECSNYMEELYRIMEANRNREEISSYEVLKHLGNLSYTSGIDCEIELIR